VAQKSKPLPNDQKIVLKPVNEIKFIVKLKYQSSTIILFVGNRYSMRDLLSDLNYALPANWRYASYTVNDVIASSGISSP